MKTSTQPALGAIRLAWWREALERLDSAQPPAEPRLQAVADHLLPCGVTGQSIAAIEDGYVAMLDEKIDSGRVMEGGAALFRVAASLLGGQWEHVEEAGRLYALAASARRGLMAFPEDYELGALRGAKAPRAIRPVTAFAKLGARDLRHAPHLEPEAVPARAVALVSHRLFGTIA